MKLFFPNSVKTLVLQHSTSSNQDLVFENMWAEEDLHLILSLFFFFFKLHMGDIGMAHCSFI